MNCGAEVRKSPPIREPGAKNANHLTILRKVGIYYKVLLRWLNGRASDL